MTLALLFAGQGVPHPWADRALLDRPATRALVAVASDAAGVDVHRALRRGARDLDRTEVQQPALVALGLAALAALEDERDLAPDLVAGHSLGELTAWAAAGCVAAEDAVRAAAVRGRLMGREAARHPGRMVRLSDADEPTWRGALETGRAAGWVTVAVHNGPREVVLSGDDAALAAIARAGVAMTPLPMAGAWHSQAMEGAMAELRDVLAALPRRPGRARLVSNRDGRAAEGDDIPERLVGQMIAPVQWRTTMETLAAAGANALAIGPGAKVLRGLGRLSGVEVGVA